jgi:hypothetical protein
VAAASAVDNVEDGEGVVVGADGRLVDSLLVGDADPPPVQADNTSRANAIAAHPTARDVLDTPMDTPVVDAHPNALANARFSRTLDPPGTFGKGSLDE